MDGTSGEENLDRAYARYVEFLGTMTDKTPREIIETLLPLVPVNEIAHPDPNFQVKLFFRPVENPGQLLADLSLLLTAGRVSKNFAPKPKFSKDENTVPDEPDSERAVTIQRNAKAILDRKTEITRRPWSNAPRPTDQWIRAIASQLYLHPNKTIGVTTRCTFLDEKYYIGNWIKRLRWGDVDIDDYQIRDLLSIGVSPFWRGNNNMSSVEWMDTLKEWRKENPGAPLSPTTFARFEGHIVPLGEHDAALRKRNSQILVSDDYRAEWMRVREPVGKMQSPEGDQRIPPMELP